MKLENIPFETTEWNSVEPTVHPGETGVAYWRTKQFSDIRVRLVEYSAGYRADHWCAKGHILFVIEGDLVTELEDGRRYTLGPGMSYQVADHDGKHRSVSEHGAKLFIVD